MGATTGIEWADATWNPVTGCDEVSPGCDRCYAKTLAERFRGTEGHYYEQGFDVTLRPDKLDLPLRWKRPRKVFVNSMSDLFHKDVPDAYIGAVFEIMAQAEHHTFQLLTKRHGRMRSLLTKWANGRMEVDSGYLQNGRPVGSIVRTSPAWTPPPNVWLGVSVEDQDRALLRVPALLETPAAVRFLSMEPLLGPVDLTHMDVERHADGMYWINALTGRNTDMGRPCRDVPSIDWVIVGGESGHGARPMHPRWATSLRDQCNEAGVPFLFKQWGEWAPHRLDGGIHANSRLSKRRDQYESVRFATDGTAYKATDPDLYSYPGMVSMLRVGKRNAGRLLDGRTWDEYPEEVNA